MDIKGLMASKKTTFSGVALLCAAIGMIAAMAAGEMEASEVTLGLVWIKICGAYGLLNARDNDVTSNDSGAQRKSDKKNGTVKMILPFAALAICGLAGCSGMIKASQVKIPMNGIMDRHDAYIEADAAMSDLQRRIYLRDSEIIRGVLDEALKKTEPE